MCRVVSFPSAIAPILDGEWRDTEEPAQFEHQGKKVAIGSIVHSQRLPAVKRLNLSANDEQFEQLLIGAALHADVSGDVNLVCGFPRVTLSANAELLKAYKDREFSVETPHGTRKICIRNIWPLYESVGHALGIRYKMNIATPLFALSIGFGTVEGVLLDANGRPVLSTLISEPLGTRRAGQLFRERLLKLGTRIPDDGGDDLWWDHLLMLAYRKDPDLNIVTASGVLPEDVSHNEAVDALRTYAEKLLAPRLKSHFDAIGAQKISFALTGGGSIYEPSSAEIKSFVEKIGFRWVPVSPELSLQTAAHGYSVAAKSRGGVFAQKVLAVDFGNSNTVYAYMG